MFFRVGSGGFEPGGASFHPLMSPHGPDLAAWQSATSNGSNVSERVSEGSIAFMFESSLQVAVAEWAFEEAQKEYYKVWTGFPMQYKHSE